MELSHTYIYIYLESHPASPILQRTFFLKKNLTGSQIYYLDVLLKKEKCLRSHAKLISDVPEYLMELVFVVKV